MMDHIKNRKERKPRENEETTKREPRGNQEGTKREPEGNKEKIKGSSHLQEPHR